jgi:hypothetical protein
MRLNIQSSPVDDEGIPGSLEIANRLCSFAVSSYPDHDFILGFGGAGTLVAVGCQEHIHAHVGGHASGSDGGRVGGVGQGVAYGIRPADVQVQAGHVGHQDWHRGVQIQFRIRKCVHGFSNCPKG